MLAYRLKFVVLIGFNDNIFVWTYLSVTIVCPGLKIKAKYYNSNKNTHLCGNLQYNQKQPKRQRKQNWNGQKCPIERISVKSGVILQYGALLYYDSET